MTAEEAVQLAKAGHQFRAFQPAPDGIHAVCWCGWISPAGYPVGYQAHQTVRLAHARHQGAEGIKP